MIFKPRGKSNKNCGKDAAKDNKNKKKKSKMEKAAEDPRINSDEREAERDIMTSRGEKTNGTNAEEAAAGDDGRKSGEREEQHCDEAKTDGEIEISKDDAEKPAGGGGAIGEKEEGNDREEERKAAALVENGETTATATVATVETQNETKEKEEQEKEEKKEGGGVANMVVENGIGTDEEDEVESLKVVAVKKQHPEEALE